MISWLASGGWLVPFGLLCLLGAYLIRRTL